MTDTYYTKKTLKQLAEELELRRTEFVLAGDNEHAEGVSHAIAVLDRYIATEGTSSPASLDTSVAERLEAIGDILLNTTARLQQEATELISLAQDDRTLKEIDSMTNDLATCTAFD